MWQRFLKQFVEAGLTLFWVMTLTFFLMRFLPGGPFDTERKLPPAIQANLEAKFHLDKPLYQQYVSYMLDVCRGDLGPSYKYLTRSVKDIVLEASGVSFGIGALALVIGVGFGILLGTLAGVLPNKGLNVLVSMIGISSISIPSFIFGAFLVFVFAYSLGWLPAARLVGPWHYVLPVITLALTPFAYTFMLVRSSVQTACLQPFVSIKQAFGLAWERITFVHILRNAMIPFVAILAPIAAGVITGSFAVEYIFAIPGLGKYFVTAVTNRDYTLVMGITLVYCVVLVVFNMVTAFVLTWVDPRLQEQHA